MNSDQIREVLGCNSTLPAVSTRNISVIEWQLPDGSQPWECGNVFPHWGLIEQAAEAERFFSTLGSPSRPYATAVDGMAIYKGVQL